MQHHEDRSDRQRAAEAFWDRWALAGNDGAPRDGSGQIDIAAALGGASQSARGILPFVHPGAHVLEIGSGVGRVLAHLAPYVGRAIGIDISQVVVEESERVLAEFPNAEVRHGDGASLAGVEADSIDLVYSVLCLIHVDKRSAFRYLREIRRVLKPGGRAVLQFQNILSQRGFEHFQETAENDFPFEFYTPEELRFLLRGAGLEVLGEHQNNEFIEVVVLRGRPDGWVREWRQGFKVDGIVRTGFFAPDGGDMAQKGRVDLTLVNTTDQWRTAEINASVHRRQGGRLARCYFADAVVFTPPQSRTVVAISYGGESRGLDLQSAAEHVAFATQRAEPLPDSGRVEVHLAIIPSGMRWNEDTARLFPSCAHAWTLTGGG